MTEVTFQTHHQIHYQTPSSYTSEHIHKMAEEKEILKIPILVHDNHDKWFCLMRIKLQGKGVGYVIEKTKNEYAAIAQLTPHTLAESKNRVDDIIKGVEELDIDDGNSKQKKVYLNIERAAKYTKDEATAIMYIIHGLSDDDQALINEYPAAIDLWVSRGHNRVGWITTIVV